MSVCTYVFHSDSDPLSLLSETICGCTSSAFADLRASLATGVYMVHVHVCVCVCVCVRVCVCVCVYVCVCVCVFFVAAATGPEELFASV